MKLGHTEVFVRDAEIARKFYTEVLGFDIVAVQDGGFSWVSLGGRELLLRPHKPLEARDSVPRYDRSAVAMVLYTDDLDATHSQLVDRGLQFGETDGSDRCLTFQDPDGNWFQLVNPDEH